jgi:hypothetical protein
MVQGSPDHLPRLELRAVIASAHGVLCEQTP